LKNGLVLANGEGVIDADYQKEVFVLLTNISDVTQSIHLNDRIAQAEVVQNFSSIVKMYETPTPPVSLSERNGGFGSTGTT
jgi:dUTPase